MYQQEFQTDTCNIKIVLQVNNTVSGDCSSIQSPDSNNNLVHNVTIKLCENGEDQMNNNNAKEIPIQLLDSQKPENLNSASVKVITNNSKFLSFAIFKEKFNMYLFV